MCTPTRRKGRESARARSRALGAGPHTHEPLRGAAAHRECPSHQTGHTEQQPARPARSACRRRPPLLQASAAGCTPYTPMSVAGPTRPCPPRNRHRRCGTTSRIHRRRCRALHHGQRTRRTGRGRRRGHRQQQMQRERQMSPAVARPTRMRRDARHDCHTLRRRRRSSRALSPWPLSTWQTGGNARLHSRAGA